MGVGFFCECGVFLQGHSRKTLQVLRVPPFHKKNRESAIFWFGLPGWVSNHDRPPFRFFLRRPQIRFDGPRFPSDTTFNLHLKHEGELATTHGVLNGLLSLVITTTGQSQGLAPFQSPQVRIVGIAVTRCAGFPKTTSLRFSLLWTGVIFRYLCQARKRNPNPNFWVRISSSEVGVFHVKGRGPKVRYGPRNQENQTLLAGYPGILPGYPGGARKVREKKFAFNFRSLLWGIVCSCGVGGI